MADRSSSLADHYRMFGRYNARANSRLLAGGSSILLAVSMMHGLLRTTKYRRVSSPQESEQQLAPALAHCFNHQIRNGCLNRGREQPSRYAFNKVNERI
jgi:uncharacterized damage-inducible protein DinB